MSALKETRMMVTTTMGDEIYVYDEFRPNGRGGRAFIGYLVDNGKDRRQVATWMDTLRLVEEWGGFRRGRELHPDK